MQQEKKLVICDDRSDGLVCFSDIHTSVLCVDLRSAHGIPRKGTADTGKKVPVVENLELSKALPLKLGIGNNMAMHASPSQFYLPSLFNCTFSIASYR